MPNDIGTGNQGQKDEVLVIRGRSEVGLEFEVGAGEGFR